MAGSCRRHATRKMLYKARQLDEAQNDGLIGQGEGESNNSEKMSAETGGPQKSSRNIYIYY